MRIVKLVLMATLSLGAASAATVGVSYTAGGKEDGSFGSSAHSGLMRAQKSLGISTLELEAENNAFKVDELAKKGADLVIGVGFLQQSAIAKTAPLYPKQHFAIIDSSVEGKNVTSVAFREEEGSYLVGFLGGLKTSTNNIGFLGGMDSPLLHKFLAGFEAGAKAANPNAKVVSQYVGSTPDAWDNPAKAKEIAKSMIARGVDIIFVAAGGSGVGAIEQINSTECIKESQLPKGVKFISDSFKDIPKSTSYKAACAGNARPVFFIGVDTNQNPLGDTDKKPETLNHGFTSMLKHVDNIVYALSLIASRGSYAPGQISFGIKQNGISAAMDNYNKDLFSKDDLKRLDDVKSMISRGTIKVPSGQ